jgi:hypothetical protein
MKHHIISIGVSEHEHTINNLTYPSKDAKDFFYLFLNSITSHGLSILLVNNEATLSNILYALKEFSKIVRDEDSFFFFFSGHGTIGKSKIDNTIAEHYLVPFDANVDVANSCLSVTMLKELLDGLKSNINIIFIDTCFSGAVTKQSKGYLQKSKISFKSLKSLSSTISGEGNLTFAACRDDEEALEDHELKNSLFSYYLIEELIKDRKSHLFPVIDIFSPISENVKNRAKNKYHHNQTPTFKGNIEENLYLPVFSKIKSLKLEEDDIKLHPLYIELLENYNRISKESVQLNQNYIEPDYIYKNIKLQEFKTWVSPDENIVIALNAILDKTSVYITCSLFKDGNAYQRFDIGRQLIIKVLSSQRKLFLLESNMVERYIIFSIFK